MDEQHFIVVTFGSEHLAFTMKEISEGLRRARELLPSPPAPMATTPDRVFTAEQMAERTDIKASWFLDQARQGKIPCVRFGKYPRFKLNEVLAVLASDTHTDRQLNKRSARGVTNLTNLRPRRRRGSL